MVNCYVIGIGDPYVVDVPLTRSMHNRYRHGCEDQNGPRKHVRGMHAKDSPTMRIKQGHQVPRIQSEHVFEKC